MPPTRMDVAACPLPELFRLLRSGDAGLAAADAAGLLKQTGPNRIASSSRRTLAADLAKRLGNPLVLVLVFAAAVSAFTGDIASCAIINAIVVFSSFST